MTIEMISAEIDALKTAYGEVTVATETPGQTLIRITTVRLPGGCTPAETPALLVLQDGQVPKVYVKPGIKVPSGVPRSTSAMQIAGEAWMQFSYNLAGDLSAFTLVQLVEASLQRFAKNE
jgi:hypothetical protein